MAAEAMHKRIVLSRAYQMSSAEDNPRAHAIDADNDLFWRQNLRRLDAEAIRDAMLAVSGRLNPAMGGGVLPQAFAEVLATESRPGFGWDQSSPAEESRRSVYIYLKRTLMVPFLETFDYTNTAESLGTRPVTTVAPQACSCSTANSPPSRRPHLPSGFAARRGWMGRNQIDRLFRLALGDLHKPRVVHRSATAGQAAWQRVDPLQSLCLVVLNLNEFIYVD